MRELEKEVKTNGTIYSLIKRNKWKAMYRAEAGHYEVFRVKILPETEIMGNHVPEREKYPGNEDFGKFAWCLRTRNQAEDLYNNLKEKKDE